MTVHKQYENKKTAVDEMRDGDLLGYAVYDPETGLLVEVLFNLDDALALACRLEEAYKERHGVKPAKAEPPAPPAEAPPQDDDSGPRFRM